MLRPQWDSPHDNYSEWPHRDLNPGTELEKLVS